MDIGASLQQQMRGTADSERGETVEMHAIQVGQKGYRGNQAFKVGRSLTIIRDD
jgi:hypothetical protein